VCTAAALAWRQLMVGGYSLVDMGMVVLGVGAAARVLIPSEPVAGMMHPLVRIIGWLAPALMFLGEFSKVPLAQHATIITSKAY
jgi:hypothetical protein